MSWKHACRGAPNVFVVALHTPRYLLPWARTLPLILPVPLDMEGIKTVLQQRLAQTQHANFDDAWHGLYMDEWMAHVGYIDMCRRIDGRRAYRCFANAPAQARAELQAMNRAQARAKARAKALPKALPMVLNAASKALAKPKAQPKMQAKAKAHAKSKAKAKAMPDVPGSDSLSDS